MILDNSTSTNDRTATDPMRAPREPANNKDRKKLRIRFRKDGLLRFISHHDLMRCWDRLFRRADLPIRKTQGFHPKPHISSPLSLSLGVAGLEEVIEVELTEDLSMETVLDRLAREVVDGLTIVSTSWHPASESCQVVAVEYIAPLPAGTPVSTIQSRRDEILAADTLVIQRKHPTKPPRDIDIRPMILEIEVTESTVRFRVSVTPQGSVRAEELLAALGIESLLPEGAVMTRSRVELAQA